jgi:hypothetical protein
VSFRTTHGTFMSARDDGTVIQAHNCKGWEQFLVLPLETGRCLLQTAHATFMCVQGPTLSHSSTELQLRHQFEIVQGPSFSKTGKVSLRVQQEAREGDWFVSASKDDNQGFSFESPA